ncbi:hypothetical protein HPG69_005776, partial [Diceros bicornis minor]
MGASPHLLNYPLWMAHHHCSPLGNLPARRLSMRPHLFGTGSEVGCVSPSAIFRKPEITKPGPVFQPSVSHSHSLFSSILSKPPVSLECQNGMCIGPVPKSHPFFFMGALPFNMKELKMISLKLIWTGSSSPTKNCSELSCCEVSVNLDQVEKIRKLSSTL